MRIHQQKFPHATLPADRVGPLTIDGTNTLILSRCKRGLWLDYGSRYHIINPWVHGLHKPTRLRRFLTALPALWEFCR